MSTKSQSELSLEERLATVHAIAKIGPVAFQRLACVSPDVLGRGLIGLRVNGATRAMIRSAISAANHPENFQEAV